MAFEPPEIQALKSGTGDQIKKLLKTKQEAKTRSKVAGMTQRKEKAAQLERDTKAWEQLLFSDSVPTQSKLKRLAEWNASGSYKSAHYTVLLDNSGSMSGAGWTELTCAFESFRQELARDPAVAASTNVSVILFNHVAHTVAPTHAKASEVQDIGHHQVGGGTDFGVAFAEAHRVIGRSPPLAKEMILFLTDGAAAVPAGEIRALLAGHGKRIADVTCVAFGRGADAGSLKEMGRLFGAEGVPFQLKTPADKATLVQTFVDAATSRAIHFGASSSS
uniref:VWFA domain-containing protein n=1 Tax=Alexandrium catenella TaxID=2925 RepID=A0A7S1RAR4_ALECA